MPTGDETTQIQEQEATINILRCMHGQLYAGNSNGEVFIYDIRTLTPVYSYKAHHPMHYTDERERELFGSMHNYAEIWSLAICPVN